MLLRATVACLVLGTLLVAPAGADAKPKRTCKAAGSRTVAQNGFARVYKTRTEEGTRLVGCVRSSGRRRLLAEASDDDYVSSADYANVRLAGRHVAWSWTESDISCKAACPPGYDPTFESIVSYDLRHGSTREVAATRPVGRALVLSRSGGFAWAGRTDPTGPVEIHASVRGDEDVVLDSGDIDPASLAIEITIISWLHDGGERFARLR
jgi:hypothetical protein